MSDGASGFDPFDRDCPSRGLLHTIGDKWVILIIVALESSPLRYGEIERKVDGISPKMLSIWLHALVNDGLIRRTAHDEIPPRVVYELTALGHTLLPLAQASVDWASENMKLVAEHRRVLGDC
ncbi:winged helix-turn-helix transcriptional regulator [Corynebacterium alimapuense]|uniref:Transcriptional regulator n=1 Tax=Corynebacterium alimapuense TaxID=1576874 RepID=A0A3M8K8B2_9CORY|nr:helix-turn-helix domain-containing protein [Corynebacterium alimapuense]RNE49461.1 transcriptional regulator [Corynebacterium alimapuense]